MGAAIVATPVAFAAFVSAPTWADSNVTQTPAPVVVATGLDNPRGLYASDGQVLVAEAGVGGAVDSSAQCVQNGPPFGPFLGGPSGRLSEIRNGIRSTVASGLPSAQVSPFAGREIMGPDDVVRLGGAFYVLDQGGGCAKSNPTQPMGLYEVKRNGSTTPVVDLGAWFATHPTAGPQDDDRDPEGVVTAVVTDRGRFIVLEGNHAQLIEVKRNGQVSRIADLSLAVGQVTFTALAIAPDGGYYVGNFGEVPYPDGSSNIWHVSRTGVVTLKHTGLTTVMDLEVDDDGRIYVLESATGNIPAPPFLSPNSGRVLRIDTDGSRHVVATGLNLAGGIALDGDRLFVTVNSFGAGPTAGLGSVLRIDL